MKGNKNILQKNKNILITSALPYVNNVPHLGNIIGCVLSADVFARFCKSYGCKTVFVCGTDEHGTTTEQKAIEEGVSPKEICDKYAKIHNEIYRWFGCSYDAWGKTSSEKNKEISIDIFNKLDANGFILEDDLEQMYDPEVKKYLADRFVEGKCPKCGYEEARGDQCDNCGNLLNPTDLINPKSKLSGKTPEVRTQKHLFIDLPKLAPQLKEWIEKTAEKANWSQNAITMTNGWLKTGLRPRCITRDLKWGVSVPKKGYENKVFYSWFDAPIGYISITAQSINDWKEWWHNPDQTELYQFMGKDNIPFHTIMFPSFLIGANDNYTLLHQISSTEYLNYEDGQFSKSRGRGVFGNDAMNSGIPADTWRYYLLVNRPETSDTQFCWNDFQEKNNNELLANLGNFVNRTLTFITRNFDKKIPQGELEDKDKDFLKQCKVKITKITNLLSNIMLKEALKEIMLLSKSANQYFQEKAPWVDIKEESTKKRAATTMHVCANTARKLAILIEPYMPFTSEKIFNMLNLEKQTWENIEDCVFNHQINDPTILFRKFEDKEITEWKEKYSGKQKNDNDKKDIIKENESNLENFAKLNLKVAKILSCQQHPDADKLLVMKISLGDEERQLVAGLKPYFDPSELIGKNIVVVSNLKPAKLRGKESQGMLLAADKNGKVSLLQAPNSKAGEQVFIDKSSKINNKEITFKDFTKVKIITKDKKAILDDDDLRILKTDSEEIIADIEDGAQIR